MTWFFLLSCSDPFQQVIPEVTGENAAEQYPTRAANVRLTAPLDGATVPNPVTFEVHTEAVARVHLEADGWSLGEAWNPGSRDSLTYTFTGTDTPRVVTLEDLDDRGQVITTDEITITVTDSTEVPAPQVRILSPRDGDTVPNPVTFEVEASEVASVHIQADDWSLGDPWDAASSNSLTYTFTSTGTPRVVTLEGLDADGAVVVSDSITLTVQNEDTPGSEGFREVPYYYQYDNRYEPSATCGLTSAAMLLSSWYGKAFVTPDDLYLAYGKDQGQSPSGLATLYGWEGLYSRSGSGATREDLRAHLDAGRPVVVHGFWTGAGHITVLVGHDGSGWIANDPAGDWYSGYGTGAWGDSVHYPYGGSWDQDLSWDGDIWWSAADTVPF